jgi:hypothetical protein
MEGVYQGRFVILKKSYFTQDLRYYADFNTLAETEPVILEAELKDKAKAVFWKGRYKIKDTWTEKFVR